MLPMWDGRTTNDKRTREDRATQPNGCWMAEFRNFQKKSDGQEERVEWGTEEGLEEEVGRPQGGVLANSFPTHQTSSW